MEDIKEEGKLLTWVAS